MQPGSEVNRSQRHLLVLNPKKRAQRIMTVTLTDEMTRFDILILMNWYTIGFSCPEPGKYYRYIVQVPTGTSQNAINWFYYNSVKVRRQKVNAERHLSSKCLIMRRIWVRHGTKPSANDHTAAQKSRYKCKDSYKMIILLTGRYIIISVLQRNKLQNEERREEASYDIVKNPQVMVCIPQFVISSRSWML